MLGAIGAKGEKGIPGTPGLKGDNGETIKIIPDTPPPPAPQIIDDSEICVDVEIVFHEAPKQGCTLPSDVVKKAIAEAIRMPENHFENVMLTTITKNGSRQLKVTFRTTKPAERIIKLKKGSIKLPLEKAKCS